jgi:uncharacterized integral membrane protein (TIGR00698 family)
MADHNDAYSPSGEPLGEAAVAACDARMPAGAWQKPLYASMQWLGDMAPGLALACMLAWLGMVVASFIGTTLMGFEKSPISAIMVTIVLGLLLRNVAGLPAIYDAGLRFAVKRVLRFGIALLGLRLSLVALGQIGVSALPIVLGCIVSALILVSLLSRALSLPPRLGSLIAVGTSICGASAIVATGPAIDAEDDEVSYAVACITLFGTITMFAYPPLAHWLFGGDVAQSGLFLGTAIHETAQVAGAGMMYQQQFDAPAALDVAATTKLVRNVCMGAVIPLMAVLYHRRNNIGAGGRLRWHQYVPLFVVAFVVLAAVRSLGDLGSDKAFGVIGRASWKGLMTDAKTLSAMCLTVAMAAIGLNTNIAQLKILGWKPLVVGLTAALLVGGVSLGLIFLLA